MAKCGIWAGIRFDQNYFVNSCLYLFKKIYVLKTFYILAICLLQSPFLAVSVQTNVNLLMRKVGEIIVFFLKNLTVGEFFKTILFMLPKKTITS